MASIYARGNKLWARLKNEAGVWTSKPTRYVVGQEAEARRYVRASQAVIDKRRKAGETAPAGPLTLRKYVAGWLERRREEGHDWTADRGRLAKHVLPVLGDRKLADIRTVDVAELVRALRFKSDPPLAARTLRNVYNVLRAALRDAAIAGTIDVNPCTLTAAQLGQVRDRDPEWRAGAVFTRAEAEVLISDPRIPFDRRVWYGFGLLAGLRPGEIGALRWRHYEPADEPLGRLLIAASYSTKRSAVKGTKTETVKSLPVHPTLAALLAEWRLGGWAAMVGRVPEPDDLIVPLPPAVVARRTRRTGEPLRGYDYAGRRWRDEDLPALGWRARANYDVRATFITLAIDDGADRTILRDRVTHTKQKRSAFDGYDRGIHWIQTCAEVAKLRIARRPLATPDATKPGFPGNVALLLGSGGGLRTCESAPVTAEIPAVSDEESRERPANDRKSGRAL